ncbi:MAG: NAD(P)/FAD-dependent oxidoreductase [Anaerolineae bacterium]|nr:NAD(P)/FAD-dependent oxidoreductase [Anaerolineae bacterium]
MKIAVIGAGIGGMAAAFDLQRAGHAVTVFEFSDYVGGLASGFKEPHWDWSVEKYYHHWFTSDRDMFALLNELGLADRVVVRRPKTVMYHQGRFYPLDSPLAALTFPGFTFADMVRFGLVTVYLRYLSSWQPLEKYTAHEWMCRYYGQRLYQVHFEPLLMGKFGQYYRDVTMAWFWARFKARTTKLATFEGGFQAFADMFAERLRNLRVGIRLGEAVQSITPFSEGGLLLRHGAGDEHFDRCLVTVSPAILARLAPQLPPAYLKGLLDLKSMGAVVLVLALRCRLSRQGYYWYNLPKSAGYPFLALVEHTNFVSPEHFGGEHIVYCGDYLDASHEYFDLSHEQLLERFLPALKRLNADFSPSWVRKSWLFRTPYAQPVPLVNHSRNIPALRTPIAGLYFASMSQVYPWDRGTNFAVQVGRHAARMMLAEG